MSRNAIRNTRISTNSLAIYQENTGIPGYVQHRSTYESLAHALRAGAYRACSLRWSDICRSKSEAMQLCYLCKSVFVHVQPFILYVRNRGNIYIAGHHSYLGGCSVKRTTRLACDGHAAAWGHLADHNSCCRPPLWGGSSRAVKFLGLRLVGLACSGWAQFIHSASNLAKASPSGLC
jgi:hypothetical protein